MNTVFLITGETKKHVSIVGQWLSNRVARTYASPQEVGATIPEMPVAILIEEETAGVVDALRKITKADIVHIHAGPEPFAQAAGSDRFHHLKAPHKPNPDNVPFLMRLEDIWREEKGHGRGDHESNPIRVP